MKTWDLHVASIAHDRVQVQSEGPASACSHFETDFLICRICEYTFTLLNVSLMGEGV